jgi:hypothetical protein
MAEQKIDYVTLAEDAAQGPIPTVPSTLYFTYKRTDGDTFVGPASNAEGYLRKGYTITGEQTIEDFAAFNAEQAAKAAPAAEAAKPAPAAKTAA